MAHGGLSKPGIYTAMVYSTNGTLKCWRDVDPGADKKHGFGSDEKLLGMGMGPE